MTKSQVSRFIRTCRIQETSIRYFSVVGENGIWMRFNRRTLAVLDAAIRDDHPAYDAMIDFAVANEPK